MNSLQINYWLKQHWKLLVGVFFGILILGTIIFQIVYPNSRMLPNANVDGVSLGWMKRTDAAKKLDDLYGEQTLKIYFGKNEAAFQAPRMSEMGIAVSNEARLAAISYPFYLRIIPGSFLWAGTAPKEDDMEYVYDKKKIETYTQSKVGDGCSIEPRDATLKVVESQLQLVPSAPGGECDITQFQQALAQVKPSSDSEKNKVTISIVEKPAAVDDDRARELATTLNNRLKEPMNIAVDKETDTIPGRIVMGWLDFKSDIPPESLKDSDIKAKLAFSVNKDRMKVYVDTNIAAKLIKEPGVSKVSTLDFKETSRVNGAGGREVNMDAALASVEAYINNKTSTAVAATRDVGPTMQYTRTYTPTSNGMAALLAQFAQDNPGTYGLAFTELSGVRNLRQASFNADTPFKSAGAESLYIAYGALMEQRTGVIRTVDTIAGNRNYTDCLKALVQRSDESCRTGFYQVMGHKTTTARGAELGLKSTVFAGKDTTTSANDLHKVVTGFAKNQIARVEGGQQLLSYMEADQDNGGIGKGVTKGRVAHMVGESGTFHNDSSVVYSTDKGNYVLTVLSDGSSWEKITDLTKKIQALRQQKMGPNDR